MERILNDDERIRRAEEIYFRRNNRNVAYSNKKETKSKRYVKDKILFQLLFMLNIAVIIFCVQNRDFIFKSEFLDVVNQYNINVGDKILELTKEVVGISDEETQINSENNEEGVQINDENESKNSQSVNTENTINQDITTEQSSSISEMELDINNLKAYSFINPVEGTITSSFGTRESELQNVTGYHTGIDIAASQDTYIKASMGGIVSLVSDEGDYGNHLKIRCNNVTTVYAHCSKIFVQEGQIVAQGQDIAAVGSTGNSTGPHLHFEIRVDDRYVDPLKILTY